MEDIEDVATGPSACFLGYTSNDLLIRIGAAIYASLQAYLANPTDVDYVNTQESRPESCFRYRTVKSEKGVEAIEKLREAVELALPLDLIIAPRGWQVS